MDANKLSTFTFTLRPLTFRLSLLAMILMTMLGLGLQTATAQAAENKPPTEIKVSGKITSKGNDNFSLQTGNETRLVKVVATTKFIQNDKPTNFSSLQVGMLVEAYLHYNTANTNPAASRWEAILVKLLPVIVEHNETISGVVRGKNNDYLALTLSNGAVRYIKVTATTVFVKNGQPATFGELQVGMAVQALIKVNSQNNTAEALRVYWQVNVVAGETWRGTVIGKGTDNFYIKLADGTARRLTVTSATVFIQNGQPSNFAALEVGKPVEVKVKLAAGSTTMGEALKVAF